jgi:hypothetical protein
VVLTECNDDQDDDGQGNNSGALATESAMMGAARGLGLEEVDKESDGKDYGKQEVNPIANHQALPAVYRTIDA